MERVLVTGGSNIGSAGVATMVYRWGQKFDSDKIVYDYLMQKRIPERKYLEDIKKKGGRIYTLANKKKINVFRMIQWFIYVMRTGALLCARGVAWCAQASVGGVRSVRHCLVCGRARL